MDKSYVTLVVAICPVCTTEHQTGDLLLDTRMRDTFERTTVTGFALCPACKQLHDDGYLALVGIDESKSTQPYKPDSVYRTGQVAHIRYHVAQDIFGQDFSKHTFIFADNELLTKLTAMAGEQQ
jgi:hypothetical protein